MKRFEVSFSTLTIGCQTDVVYARNSVDARQRIQRQYPGAVILSLREA